MKRKTREENAITLIALIITIVLLLILAVVTINSVTGDGIIQHAVNAKEEYITARDKERIQIDVLEWHMLKEQGETTLKDFFAGKYGAENVQLNTDKSITVKTKDGERYKITENGQVILLDSKVEIVTNKLNGTLIDVNLYTDESPFQHIYEFGSKTLDSSRVVPLDANFDNPRGGSILGFNTRVGVLSGNLLEICDYHKGDAQVETRNHYRNDKS